MNFYQENDFLPLSGIQHLVFCERQFSLIHHEQVWIDNILTIQGQSLHRRVNERKIEKRGQDIIVSSLHISSSVLGLNGIADVVEYHHTSEGGINLNGIHGLFIPFPVEYKHGKPKPWRCDEVQLCAQAICLEEMHGIEIKSGDLFYGKTKRRQRIIFDSTLRELVKQYARRMHELISSSYTPKSINDNRCKNCSLNSICLPSVTSSNGINSIEYLQKAVK